METQKSRPSGEENLEEPKLSLVKERIFVSIHREIHVSLYIFMIYKNICIYIDF